MLNLLSSCATQQQTTTQTLHKTTSYILVRHAEKVKGVKDPDLSKEGLERAKSLAYLLKDVKVDVIYSSDYKRTQQTALPVAKGQKLEVQSYDPRNLEGLIEEIEKKIQRKNSFSGRTFEYYTCTSQTFNRNRLCRF